VRFGQQRPLGYALALCVLAAATGCADRDSIAMPQWQLSVEGEPRGAVTLPGRLDARLPSRRTTYRLSTDVALPAPLRGAPATLDFPYFVGRARPFANERPLVALQRARPGAYRRPGPQSFAIPPEATASGTLRLVIEVDHEFTQSAWWQRAPRLRAGAVIGGQVAAIDTWMRWSNASALGAVGAIGVASLILFLFDRRRRDYGWMTLQAAAVLYFPLFHLGVTSSLPATVDVPLLGLCVGFAGIAMVFTTHAQLNLRAPPRAFAALSLGLLASAVALSDPFVSTRWLGRIVIASVVVSLSYLTAVLIGLWQRGKAPVSSRTQLIALGLLSTAAVPDLLFWTDIGDDPFAGLRATSIGLTIYCTLQYVALGQIHANALSQSEQQRDEIEGLNDDLQRQIAERSRQLAYALARLARADPEGANLAPGDVVDDRYRVTNELGAGASGIVYRVERLRDGRAFAMKVLMDASHPRHLARFAREAQLVSRIKHPNVVGIVDVDFSGSGHMYLVMELVNGPSLLGAKDRFGDREWALSILGQVASGMRALHELGIVHRDLKPANVLLARTDDGPQVKLTDFGVSRGYDDGDTGERENADLAAQPQPAFEPPPDQQTATLETVQVGARSRRPARAPARPTAPELTHTGTIIGTPAYMGPELGRGQEALAASDVYGFGVLAFELLAGQRPFAIAPVLALLSDQPAPEPLELARLVPDLDGDLAATLQRCIALEPEARPSAIELCEALERTGNPRPAASDRQANDRPPGTRGA